MADVRRSIAEGDFEQFRRTDPRCSLGPREPGAVVGADDNAGAIADEM